MNTNEKILKTKEFVKKHKLKFILGVGLFGIGFYTGNKNGYNKGYGCRAKEFSDDLFYAVKNHGKPLCWKVKEFPNLILIASIKEIIPKNK